MIQTTEEANITQLIEMVATVIEENVVLNGRIEELENEINVINKSLGIKKSNFTIAEAAKILRTGKNVIYNLVSDGQIRAMNLPTQSIPDFEIERFRQTILSTQEDLSKYADKQFAKKYLDKKEPAPIVKIRKKELQNA